LKPVDLAAYSMRGFNFADFWNLLMDLMDLNFGQNFGRFWNFDHLFISVKKLKIFRKLSKFIFYIWKIIPIFLIFFILNVSLMFDRIFGQVLKTYLKIVSLFFLSWTFWQKNWKFKQNKKFKKSWKFWQENIVDGYKNEKIYVVSKCRWVIFINNYTAVII